MVYPSPEVSAAVVWSRTRARARRPHGGDDDPAFLFSDTASGNTTYYYVCRPHCCLHTVSVETTIKIKVIC